MALAAFWETPRLCAYIRPRLSIARGAPRLRPVTGSEEPGRNRPLRLPERDSKAPKEIEPPRCLAQLSYAIQRCPPFWPVRKTAPLAQGRSEERSMLGANRRLLVRLPVGEPGRC